MLGIDTYSSEYKNFQDIYHEVLQNNKPDEDKGNSVIYQIRLDVNRTFKNFKLKFLNAEVESGHNKLYNLLKVYALILDPEIGYT